MRPSTDLPSRYSDVEAAGARMSLATRPVEVKSLAKKRELIVSGLVLNA